MKVLVTGANGFVGKKLLLALDAEPAINEVYALTSQEKQFEGNKIKSISVNLSTNEGLQSHTEISDVDVIVHLAGSPGVWFADQHPAKDLIHNTGTLLSVLEMAQKWKTKRVVLASTCQIYSMNENDPRSLPDNFYGLSKRTAEDYLGLFSRKTGIEKTILRMSWIYGPGMKKNPIYDLINYRNSSDLKLFCSLDDALDFIYVDDVVQALRKGILNSSWEGKTLNISSGQSVSIRNLIEMLDKLTGVKNGIQGANLPPRITCHANTDAIKLGWKQEIDIQEGFERTLKYFTDEAR